MQVQDTCDLIFSVIPLRNQYMTFGFIYGNRSRFRHPFHYFPSNFAYGLLVMIKGRRIDEDNVSAAFIPRVRAFDPLHFSGARLQPMINRHLAALRRNIDKLNRSKPFSSSLGPRNSPSFFQLL
jgi:hypothetical protein